MWHDARISWRTWTQMQIGHFSQQLVRIFQRDQITPSTPHLHLDTHRHSQLRALSHAC